MQFGLFLGIFLSRLQFRHSFSTHNFIFMGKCFSQTQISRKDQPSEPTRSQHKQSISRKKSLVSATTNPQQPSYKSCEVPTLKINENRNNQAEPQARNSCITLSELIQNAQNGGLGEWQLRNHESSTIRMTREKPLNKPESEISLDVRSQILSQVSKEQNLAAKMEQDQAYAKLMIRLAKIDFQFILPKCRGGPLVVPLINYAMYQP